MQADKLKALLRHRQHLIDQGLEPDQAEKKLRSLFPNELNSQAWQQRGSRATAAAVPRRLGEHVSELQLPLGEVHAAWETASQAAQADGEPLILATREMTTSVAGTVALAVIVCFIIQLYVLPAFAEAYEQTGAELPALTSRLLEQPVWVWLLVACLLVPLLFAWFIQRQLSELQALRANTSFLLRQLPAISGVAQHLEAAGILRLYRALRALKASPAACRKACSDAMLKGEPQHLARQLLNGLANANELGTEEMEIKHWRRRLIESNPNNLIQPMQRSYEQLLVVLVGSAIGVLLIAIYLPIFALPSLISH